MLGEGTFLEYLAFVERYAPDPVTADIARRARVDEARHVAFGVEHARHASRPIRTAPAAASGGGTARRVPRRRERTEPPRRGGALVLAAGGITPSRIRDGVKAVRTLQDTMHRRRVTRLTQLGFPRAIAEEISEMHTPNFM